MSVRVRLLSHCRASGFATAVPRRMEPHTLRSACRRFRPAPVTAMPTETVPGLEARDSGLTYKLRRMSYACPVSSASCVSRWLAAACVLVLATSIADAQWLNYRTPGTPRLPDGSPDLSAPPPRLGDGRPDLSGIWAAECAIYGRDSCFTRSLFFNLAKD